MGNTPSSSTSTMTTPGGQLPSNVLRPIGLVPAFTWSDEVILKLREKPRNPTPTVDGEDYRITEVDSEELVFRCSGRSFSWRDKKVLFDALDQPILNITNKLLVLNHEYIIREGQSSNPLASRELARIVSRLSLGDGAGRMQIRFTNATDGEPIELILEGDWTTRVGEIKMGGQPLARIGRSGGYPDDIVTRNEMYNLTVAPGVDAALMVAICICLDERLIE